MIRNLTRDAAIYGIGNIFAKAISFLTIPIYTRIFSPTEFGLLEIVLVLNGVYGAIILLGLDSAQSLYFNKYKNKGIKAQREIITSILQLRVIWGILITLMVGITLPFWVASLNIDDLSLRYIIFALFGTFLSQISSQSIEILRLVFRPFLCVAISTLQSLISVGCILLFVLKYEYGISGFLLGSFIGACAFVFIAWSLNFKFLDLSKIHSTHWNVLIKFGIPLIPEALILHGMLIMDRIFLQNYQGAAAVGVYAIAIRFSVILAACSEVFRKAWWPYALKYMYEPNGQQKFKFVARLYVNLMCAFILLITLLSPLIVKYFVGNEYSMAKYIIGILCWQPFFYGLILVLSAGVWKTEKTNYNFYLTGIALVIGLILNYCLVPTYALVGASIATAVTYFIWTVLTLIVSERLWRVEYPIYKIGTDISITAVFMFLFLTQYGSLSEMIVGLTIICISYHIVQTYRLVASEK